MEQKQEKMVVELGNIDKETLQLWGEENHCYVNSLSSQEMESLSALCDTFLPAVDVKTAAAIHKDIADFFRASASATGTPERLGGLMSERLKHPKKWLVRLCLWLLSTCIGSLILCGRYCFSSKFPYMHSFTQLPQNKREAVLVSWSLSYFHHLRMLYKAMKLLILLVFFTQVNEKNENLSWKAIGYKGPDPEFKTKSMQRKTLRNEGLNDDDDEGQNDDGHEEEAELYGPLYKSLINMQLPRNIVADSLRQVGFPVSVRNKRNAAPSSIASPSLVIKCDAVVVGSGSGGGVIAGVLAKAGYKVLVLEKGSYCARSNLSLLEGKTMDQMYLGGGMLATDDMGVILLAGSTVGGGSTINWSASIKTPKHVANEWCDEYELKLFESDLYKEAMEVVCERMGVQSEVEEEGFNNAVLRRGCKELGYPVNNIPRNSPPDHYCGWCCLGCRDGSKKGTSETWLVDLVNSGNSAILPGCEAIEVLHKKRRDRNVATGVAFEFQYMGAKDICVVESKVTIVACGALSTPNLLKRSGLKNANIGKNLHLHPVTMAWGYFPKTSSSGEWPEEKKTSYEGGGRKWEPFHTCLMKGSRGSKILVTTRKETVSTMMSCADMITVRGMSTEECWSLFESIAFFGKSSSEIGQLEAIGKSIVDKCKGLPLAVKTIGSLLRYKRTREQWQNILESEVWQIRELEEKLFAPLQLSYDDLPSEIKPCFSYCAVFSKDHSIKKEELINLWMAQGYIRSKSNEELEMIGEEYFNYLASRSFFQEFEKDDMGVAIGCKMHDITHDFAVYLTENECYSTDVNGIIKSLSSTPASQKKLRHLMLMLGHINASFSFAKLNAKKLRSLLIHSNHWVSSRELQDVFKQFTCLRALRICGENVWEIGNSKIPKAMKNLIHLRFLKLSWLRIKELPETCCELINLETFEINRCTRLKRLPQRMEKLINLRHLIIMNHVYLEYMPRGIERLTGLRTLSEFVVGCTSGKHASKVCKLEALKGMNHLRGLLKIRMLGDLAKVDEAKHVDLKEKKNLDRLELWFDNVGMTDKNEENDEAITKVLQLPPNLEYLGILHYRGRSLIFPNWIESFNKLKKLLFIDCKKCESMPPLGQLPSLEVLTIWYMESVERVGDEFLGIENGRLHGMSSSSSSSVVTAFPKLKHLTIKGWKKWDEWYFAKEDITIMPQLNSLDISLCNNLKSLPDQILQSKTLENLTIEKCPILEERFKKDTGEEWPKISRIPSVRIGHWYV